MFKCLPQCPPLQKNKIKEIRRPCSLTLKIKDVDEIKLIIVYILAKCAKGCRNGGKCVAPNKCLCKPEFTGKTCKKGKNRLNL